MSPLSEDGFRTNRGISEKQDFSCDHSRSLVSLRLSDFKSEDEEEWRWLKRCVKATGKGFLIGTGLKGGLALFAFLARLRSRWSRKTGMLSNGEAAEIAFKETLRYGLFLGTYAGIFVSVDEFIAAIGGHKRMWTCILFRIFKRCNIPMVVVGTFPTGLALAIEKKSRRMEISLYCLARALESFFTCMNDVGLCPQALKLRRADVVVFSLSTAVIMHCYAQERDVFRSKYLNVLDWVFGVPPRSDQDVSDSLDVKNLKAQR